MENNSFDGCYSPDLEFVTEHGGYGTNTEMDHNLSQMPPLSPDFVFWKRNQHNKPAKTSVAKRRAAEMEPQERRPKPPNKIGVQNGNRRCGLKKKIALCRAWVEVFEDRHAADYQMIKVFWKKNP